MDKKMIYEIREFNRFYTKVLGLFNNHLLDTNYSLTEARVLLEISERTECIANNLVQEFNIDRSYMSRIVRKLEREELIEKKSSTKDNRKNYLLLTKKGEEVLGEIHSQSDKQIDQLYDGLSDSEVNEILNSMMKIKEKLDNKINEHKDLL